MEGSQDSTLSHRDLDDLHPAIAAGETDAFARWMAAAEPVLRASLRSFAAVVDVEAVLQESLLRLWQVAPRFRADGRGNGLLRLAVRIARNYALGEARRLRPDALADVDLDRLAEPSDPFEPDPALRRIIVECRDGLPPKPAQALAARLEFGGVEPDVVLAERLGMKPNTFLQNFTRARKLLADCLQRHGVDLQAVLP